MNISHSAKHGAKKTAPCFFERIAKKSLKTLKNQGISTIFFHLPIDKGDKMVYNIDKL